MKDTRFRFGECAWPGCTNPAQELCLIHTDIPLPPRTPQSGPVDVIDTHGRLLIPSVRLDKEPRAQEVPTRPRIADADEGHHDRPRQPDWETGRDEPSRSSQEWRA